MVAKDEGDSMSGSRDAILGSIRSATARMAPGEESTPAYRRSLDLSREETLERFESRLADYGVTVLRARARQVAGVASAQLGTRRVETLLIPPGLPEAWRPQGPRMIEDAGQAARELDGIAGVMAGCAVAIAESGTIVLDAGPGQGRRAATLLPDYLLCVVLESQVVGLLPEAMPRLRPAVDEGRPITFISGPSATADIELNRVQGVHGPRTLDVILAG